MKLETKQILSDPEVVTVRQAHFERLSAVFDGETFDEAFVLNGLGDYSEDDSADWESYLDTALDNLAQHAETAKGKRIFRPLALNYNPHGVHFIDYIFGADVYRMDDGSWQTHYLDTPVGTLERPDLEENDSWLAATGLARAFLERDVPGVLFSIPTIASALNIAVNLYGQKIFETMLSDPAAARHDLRVINDLLCEIHQWYIDNIPAEILQPIVGFHRTQPPGFGQICGCTTQLLSPDQFADFVAPLDDELLSVYPNGGMIHLCGTHTQHIPVWREMKSLRAIQVNDRAADDFEQFYNELRPDQVFYVNVYPGMTIERTMEISGGARVVLVGDIQTPPKGCASCQAG